MIKVTKQKNGNIILNIDNSQITLNFNENKIWLTKKEIAKVFWIKKSEVREILNQIQESSKDIYNKNTKRIINLLSKKEKTYYSIDLIISLWYRFKSFTATKLLIKINRTLKNLWINRKSIFNKIRDWLEKFSIESYFEKKYVLNL